MSGFLVACAAGVTPTPTDVDTAIRPTSGSSLGTNPGAIAPTALPTVDPAIPKATVRRGTIEEVVILTGSVVAQSELAIAAPETTLTRRILVGPGRTVDEGQPLIETERSERQRRVDELSGREQAAARRAEAAQIRIQERQRQVSERLSRLPQPGAIVAEVQLAQSTVLQTRLGLQRAEADLASLTSPPSPVDVRLADQQIRTAEFALQRAEAERERVLDGPSDAELRQAEADVATAEADVRRAVDALQKLESGPDGAKVLAARRAVQLAQSELRLAQQPPPEIDSAKELIRAARNRNSRERRDAEAAARRQVELALARQSLDIQRAEAELVEAVRTLQDVSKGAAPDEASAASRDLDVALRKVAQARERLVVLQSGPAQIEIHAADASVESARALLEQAQARRRALDAGPPADQVSVARAAVSSARAALASAEERLVELTSQQQEAVQAQAQLDLFEGIRSGAVYAPDEAAKPGTDPDIVEFAEAQKELAQTRNDLAPAAADPVSTTLVAPAAGLITAVLTGPGEETGPDRPAVTMVKAGDLVVRASVEAPDVSRIVAGTSARVRLLAAPNTDHAASVDRVDANDGHRRAQFSVTWSSPLPAPGAEAQALVSLGRRENVLLVPIGAIRTEGERRFVVVVRGDTTQPVTVTTGMSDGRDIEIVDGVQEGQLILIGT